jgi:hypothetical protein
VNEALSSGYLFLVAVGFITCLPITMFGGFIPLIIIQKEFHTIPYYHLGISVL